MKIKELLPLSREDLRELINDGIIQINEEIDINKDIDEYSFSIKMALLKQLNSYYAKRATKDFKNKIDSKTIQRFCGNGIKRH